MVEHTLNMYKVLDLILTPLIEWILWNNSEKEKCYLAVLLYLYMMCYIIVSDFVFYLKMQS
jgi:hypothetical protein